MTGWRMTDTVSYGPHRDQVVELWGGGGPVVVLLHGGFWREVWDRQHSRAAAEALAALGTTVLLPEYRRIPGDPDATVDDVRAALATVPATGEVTLAGHSAGGHLALWAASVCPPPRLTRVVGLAPVADLVLAERLGLGDGAVRAYLGTGADRRPDLDPAARSTPTAAVTLVAADRDDDVPPALLQAYQRRHPSTRIVTVVDAEHMDLVDPTTDAWATVVRELLG